jgi:hypothetical protein
VSEARLILEPWRQEGDALVVAASLDDPQGHRHRLWWRLPAQHRDALTPWADPFVVAMLIPMMQWRRSVLIEGRVSPSLLANIERFMALVSVWSQNRYECVALRGAEEVECPAPLNRGQAVTTFSSGLDSCYTVYRHRRGLLGRRNRNITAAVVMHGFDIWLDQDNAAAMYQGLLTGSRTMLDSLDVSTIPLATNFHELPVIWGHSLVNHLAGSLRLLAGRFDVAVVANGVAYSRLGVRWGVHPLPLSFLDSNHFWVREDGAEASRIEKIQLVSQWPEAMRHLRVCFDNPGSHANCCGCEKCIRTILAFRAAGVPLPPAFARDVTNRQIRRARFHHEQDPEHWLEIARGAEQRGYGSTGWVRSVYAAIRRDGRRRRWRWLREAVQPLRNQIRRLFRGSPLSRKELAAQAKALDAQGPPPQASDAITILASKHRSLTH